ncbi:hypothetical protein [Mycobacterium sp.]|uniref:hypothetical protein n=1 Tax=Mycobacterium sp. TaxID=1785 RepID=UPI003F9A162C
MTTKDPIIRLDWSDIDSTAIYPRWRFHAVCDGPREYRIAQQARENGGWWHLLMLTNDGYANSQNFRTLDDAKRAAEAWESVKTAEGTLDAEGRQQLDQLRQHARELAPEADSFEEFAEAFGLGSVCERCGRKGLDDEDYTDCDVVPGDDPEAPFDILVCNECLKKETHE